MRCHNGWISFRLLCGAFKMRMLRVRRKGVSSLQGPRRARLPEKTRGHAGCHCLHWAWSVTGNIPDSWSPCCPETLSGATTNRATTMSSRILIRPLSLLAGSEVHGRDWQTIPEWVLGGEAASSSGPKARAQFLWVGQAARCTKRLRAAGMARAATPSMRGS
jgi:hypothetical protein